MFFVNLQTVAQYDCAMLLRVEREVGEVAYMVLRVPEYRWFLGRIFDISVWMDFVVPED